MHLVDQHRQVLRAAVHRVAALAVERDGDPVGGDGLGEHQIGHGQRVADRAVEQGDGVGEPGGDLLAGDGEDPVPGAAVVGDQSGVPQFVGQPVAEADRVGVHRVVVQPGGERGDQ